jgi:hypothetical protein
MKSPLWPLQIALFQRVKALSSFPVSDATEETASFPYIKMGETHVIDWSDKSKPGQTVVQTVHFWSQYQGRKECLEMMDDVLRAISNGWKPDLGAEFNVVHQELDGQDVIVDLDGVTRHGILRMKYLIEET